MARGDRGIGLAEYARLSHGDACRYVIYSRAQDDLRVAIAGGAPSHAQPHFEAALAVVDQAMATFVVADGLDWAKDGALGGTTEERTYRTWCLDNTLVLNPLNDIGLLAMASCDALGLPGVATPVRELIPHFHCLFNQLKQEYFHGRLCLYEGVTEGVVCFADRGRHLTNTMDYHSLSMCVERIRIAFRIAYSLLDKVAHFLNEYLGLARGERVYLRTIWYTQAKPEKGLRPALQGMSNRPLMGLFWLSKDLLSRGMPANEAIEPDTAELSELRNALEHTALHIHEPVPLDMSERMTPMALHIDRDDFERKTLRLLQMSRAALIYTALAVGVEERHRRNGRPIPSVQLQALDTDA